MFYKLVDRQVVPIAPDAKIGSPEWEAGVLEWSEVLKSEGRIVAQETVNGVWISTVFMGVEVGLSFGPPLVFETMAFRLVDGTPAYGEELECERCSTLDEAEAQHREVVERIKHLDEVARPNPR